jgi:hypothetical protein
METPQTHCYAAGTVTLLWKCHNSLSRNSSYHVTIAMQYNSLFHNRNYYVTMEMQYGA